MNNNNSKDEAIERILEKMFGGTERDFNSRIQEAIEAARGPEQNKADIVLSCIQRMTNNRTTHEAFDILVHVSALMIRLMADAHKNAGSRGREHIVKMSYDEYGDALLRAINHEGAERAYEMMKDVLGMKMEEAD